VKKTNKVAKAISLSEDRWNKIDAVKSPEKKQTSFIGITVEEYINNHCDDKLEEYLESNSAVVPADEPMQKSVKSMSELSKKIVIEETKSMDLFSRRK